MCYIKLQFPVRVLTRTLFAVFINDCIMTFLNFFCFLIHIIKICLDIHIYELSKLCNLFNVTTKWSQQTTLKFILGIKL